MKNPLQINKTKCRLLPNKSRIIAKFTPGSEITFKRVSDYVLSLTDDDYHTMCQALQVRFSDRHHDYEKILMKNFQKALNRFSQKDIYSHPQKLLIGAYFTAEYATESAALFNPSIIPHPNQDDLQTGETRFIMSLRGVGEGHVSSINFCTGTINHDNEITLDQRLRPTYLPKIDMGMQHSKALLIDCLAAMNINESIISLINDQLPDQFPHYQPDLLMSKIFSQHLPKEQTDKAIDLIRYITNSQYRLKFDSDYSLSERVIFPQFVSPDYADIINGLEDARFVYFADDDNEKCYYATYTAYNGRDILPKLIRTTDFLSFDILPLVGPNIAGKGMALFPRKISGKYAMLTRQDVNNYIMLSDSLYAWGEATLLSKPEKYWDIVKIGNCGSPLETDKGWLVLTHGKGMMREYRLGAMLLDLDDPSQVIAQLHEPFLVVDDKDREGYTPNVVYSCGSMLKDGCLIIPYGISDQQTDIATIKLDDLLENMTWL
ncbi:MAG: glycosidase [Gammaproteobacteria bacterium]|nr:glycosidase [Gammaproteobacteria bacterium]